MNCAPISDIPRICSTFSVRCSAKYHVDEPREFFTTNAFWSVPSDPTNDTNPHQPPFYNLVGDQQTARPSFRLATAMVGFNREFLSAYISAHSDPENYGKITVLRLPTGHPDPRPRNRYRTR